MEQEEGARFGEGQSDEDLPEKLLRREERLESIRQEKAALETEARPSRAAELRDQTERGRQGVERETRDKATRPQG